MKQHTWRLPDGIDEVLPPAAWALEQLRRRVLDLFVVWGYEYVVPPLVEYLDSLLVGAGNDLELQTFRMVDQRSGRMLG
ncbi:MAG: ATP phosphoribosyltransferase regulatory subunit, partial [Proteobacteria bacterium]|nr:ATP phosphoribosyltransferase regulatory subunit [Pseudomonadota bacterium]